MSTYLILSFYIFMNAISLSSFDFTKSMFYFPPPHPLPYKHFMHCPNFTVISRGLHTHPPPPAAQFYVDFIDSRPLTLIVK